MRMVRMRPVRARGVLRTRRKVECIVERTPARVVARLRVRDEVLGHRVDLVSECVLVVSRRDGRRLAVRLPHRLALILEPARELAARKKNSGCGAHQICTLRADMSSILASAMRSSVEGKAVRLYVSLRTLSCAASARLRFFLIVGSSGEVGVTGGGEYDRGGATWEEPWEET